MSLTLMPRPGSGPAPRRRGMRGGWLALGITGAGLGLIPWLAYLAISLPSSTTASHWPAAWAGLDAMEAAGLISTGVLLLRRDARACLTAAGTAALLLADAWFDVTTAPPGSGALTSLLMAVLAELPAAALCAGLAIRGLRRPPGAGQLELVSSRAGIGPVAGRPVSAAAPGRSDADRRAWAAACLVDGLDTIVTCEFAVRGDELPIAAGIMPQAWPAEIAPAFSHGRLALEDGCARRGLSRSGGSEPVVAAGRRRPHDRGMTATTGDVGGWLAGPRGAVTLRLIGALTAESENQRRCPRPSSPRSA
jgi:hypothetical protein